MAAQKRIAKELDDLSKSPPSGISVSLADDSNLFLWNAVMDGPTGSPYAGGIFHLTLTLPTTYPFKPPTLNFKTRIYHPNITNDSPPNNGAMCLGMLKPEEWKPPTKMAAVLEFARQLLKEPNPDDAVEVKIAEQYKNDRGAYEKEAREWTKKHAKK